MTKLSTFTLLCLVITLCWQQGYSQLVTFSPITPSYVNDHHAAAGFLTALDNGKILHFFRLDPTTLGNHVGNTGKIVMRSSIDNGSTWTEPTTIYEDQYDDRNVNGGRTLDGRIVLFFRRINAPINETLDTWLMYSDDEGQTWTTDTLNMSPAICAQTHQLIHVEEKGYMQAFYHHRYFDIRFSPDAINWDSITWLWDYRQTQTFNTSEVSFTYAGNGKMIGLIRNDDHGPFYQVTSIDTGRTWTEPMLTNIATPYFCPSPNLFYDEETDRIYVIAFDRRNENGFSPIDSKMWIYQNHVDEVLNNPTNWTLIQQFTRAEPNNYRTYGYPSWCKKTDGNYLVVFVESSHNGTEDANLYQFDIIKQSQSISAESTDQEFHIYPNPTESAISCDSFIEGLHKIYLYDLTGRLLVNTRNLDKLNLENQSSGVYYYKIYGSEDLLHQGKLIKY